jgi:hypothetical protein
VKAAEVRFFGRKVKAAEVHFSDRGPSQLCVHYNIASREAAHNKEDKYVGA